MADLTRGRSFVEKVLGDGVESVNAEGSRTDSRTVTLRVPSDFNTVADAIAEIKELRRTPGLKFEVLIESGHEWQETVDISGQDLRHVTITSEDSQVPIRSDWGDGNAVEVADNAVAPVWDIVLDGNSHVENCLDITRNSDALVRPGAGAVNCDRGVTIQRNSTIYAADSIFADMATRGVSLTHNSNAHLESADLSNCGTQAARSAGSRMILRHADVSGAGQYGIRCTQGAMVEAGNVTATNCGELAALVKLGSICDLRSSQLQGTDNDVDVEVDDGCIVSMSDDPITSTDNLDEDVDGIYWVGSSARGFSTLDASDYRQNGRQMETWERLDAEGITSSDSPTTVQFDGLESSKTYKLEYSFRTQDDTGHGITINGDDADGNENYAAWDHPGKNPDLDRIPLYEGSDFGFLHVSGEVVVSSPGGSTHVGVSHQPNPARWDRISTVYNSGGYSSGGISSIELTIDNPDTEGVVRIYERS